MSYGLNKVMLIGHLGADPELKYTNQQVPVVSFRVATNESYRDQEGNVVPKVEWHNITAWRKTAELLAEYLRKGSKVYLEGKLQTRSWEDKDGNKRYTTEIIVDDFMFLDAKGNGGERGGERGERGSSQHGGGQHGGSQHGDAGSSGGGKNEKDSDLPF
jgi:single-strand DNA-binding protein